MSVVTLFELSEKTALVTALVMGGKRGNGYNRRAVPLVEAGANFSRVNTIAPISNDTDNSKALRNNPAYSKSILDRIPSNRLGRVKEFAGEAVNLTSPAYRYVHGPILTINRGWMDR